MYPQLCVETGLRRVSHASPSRFSSRSQLSQTVSCCALATRPVGRGGFSMSSTRTRSEAGPGWWGPTARTPTWYSVSGAGTFQVWDTVAAVLPGMSSQSAPISVENCQRFTGGPLES